MNSIQASGASNSGLETHIFLRNKLLWLSNRNELSIVTSRTVVGRGRGIIFQVFPNNGADNADVDVER